MSTEIDSKVVEMQFDNQDFEKNVNTSISTLDKLKAALRFDGVSDAFTKVEKESRGINFAPMSDALDTVSLKFNALEIAATTALANITNSAVNAGKNLLKSLTTDNIAEGWSKFSDTTVSTGTLVSQGYDIDTVTEQLNRLNWFTDETSYNFTEMVANIAKFTATGQKLDKSVTAMEGIALWAAKSGQNAQTASRAMYQLSQALGSGYMSRQDWASITNASMDTAEFRQMAIDTAISLGTLEEVSDGVYRSLSSTAKEVNDFTLTGFVNELTNGQWFTSDVMMAIYEKYADAVNQITDYTEESGLSASEVISLIYKTAEEKAISLDEAIQSLGMSFESFALKAFESGQEARTFTDVIDSVKDAVGTGWMKTFQLIVGNYEQAKTLFTDMANSLWDIFAGPGEGRNEILEQWNMLGGREKLIKALYEACANLRDILEAVKDAFHEVFPEPTARKLLQLTSQFARFIHFAVLTDEELKALKRNFQALFAIFDLIGKTLIAIVKGFDPLLDAFKDILGLLVPINDNFVDFVIELDETANSMGYFEKITNRVSNALEKILGFFNRLLKAAIADYFIGFSRSGNIVTGVLTALMSVLGSTVEGIIDFVEATTGLDLSGMRESIENGLSSVFNFLYISFDNLINNIKGMFTNLTGATNITDFFGKLGESIKNFFANITGSDNTELVRKVLDSISSFLEDIAGKGNLADAVKFVIAKIQDALSYMWNAFGSPQMKVVLGLIQAGVLARIALGIIEFLETLQNTSRFGPLVEIYQGIVDSIDAFQDKIEAETTLANAKALALMAASLWALSTIPAEQLASALIGLGGAFTFMMVSLNQVKDIVAMAAADAAAVEGLKAMALVVLSFSVSISILGAAVKNLSTLNYDEIMRGLFSVVSLMFTLTKSMRGLSGLSSNIYEISGAMIVMAVAINLLAVAVKFLSSMELIEMATGLFTVLSMMFTLAESMKLLNNLSSNIYQISGAMIVLAVAIDMLTVPILLIGQLDPVGAAVAMGGICAMLLSFAGVGAILDKVQGDLRTACASMILLSIALNMLVPSIILLGALPWQIVLKGLGYLAGMLVELCGAAIAISKWVKDIEASAGAMIFMAIAINALVIPITILGALPWQIVALGILEVGVMLAGLVIAAKALSSCTMGVMAAATGMVIMAAALTLLAIPIAALSLLKPEQAMVGVLAMVVPLVAMVGALAIMKKLGPMALVGALALTMVGDALKKIGVVLIEMRIIANNWKVMAIGIAGLMATLAGILVILHFAKGEIGGAVTFLLFARALVDIQIAVVGLMAALLPLVSVILSLKSSLGGLTAALIAVAGAMVAGVLALVAALSANAEEIFGHLTKIFTELFKFLQAMIPVVVKFIVAALAGILLGLLEGLDYFLTPLLDVIFTILIKICEALRDWVPPLVEVLAEVLDVLLIEIGRLIPVLVKTLFDMLLAIIDGIANEVLTEENGERLKNSILHFFDNLMYFICGLFGIDSVYWDALKFAFGEMIANIFSSENLQEAIEVFRYIAEWISGWLNYCWENIQAFWARWAMGVEMIKEAFTAAKEFVVGIVNWLYNLGANIYETVSSFGSLCLEGFINGIKDTKDKVMETVSGFANDVIGKVEGIFKIESPSEVFHKIADFCTQGFGNGIEDTAGGVKDTVKGFGETILSGFDGFGDLFHSSGEKCGWEWMNGFKMNVNRIGKQMQLTGPGSYMADKMMAEYYESTDPFGLNWSSNSMNDLVDEDFLKNNLLNQEEEDKTKEKKKSAKEAAQEMLEQTPLVRVIRGSSKAIKNASEELDKRFEESAKKYDELLERYKNGIITREQYDKQYTEILKSDIFNRTRIVEHAEEQMRDYVKEQLQGINDDYEAKLSDIQSKMDSFSSSMQSSLKDSFEFTTQGDIYNQTVDEYQKQIDILTKKRDELKEKYGEDYQEVQNIQKQIDEITKKQEEYKTQYEESGVKDDEIVGVQFTEKLKEDTKALEEYNKSLGTLMQRGIVTEDIKGMISGMSKEEGKALVDYLNTLSDKELGDIIDQWERNQKASQELADTLYKDEIKTATEQYVDDVTSVLGYLPETANEIGKSVAHELAQGFSDGTHEALSLIDITMNDILSQIGANVDETIQKQNPIANGVNTLKNLIDTVGGKSELVKRKGSPVNASNLEKQLDTVDISLNNKSKSTNATTAQNVEKSGTIKDKLLYYFGGQDNTSSFNKIDKSLNKGFGEMKDAFQSMQVILDANSLADGLAEPINKKIGRLATARGRGM